MEDIKYLPGFCPSVNAVSCALYLGADQLLTAEPYKAFPRIANPIKNVNIKNNI